MPMPGKTANLLTSLPKRRIITAIANGCANASIAPDLMRSAIMSC